MKLFLDTVDEAALGEVWPTGAFAGVTTNPLMLAGSETTVEEVVGRCRRLGVPRLFLQAAGDDFEAILHDAVRIAEIWSASAPRRPARVPRATARPRRIAQGGTADGLWIKVPATDQGYRAMARLRAEGIAVAATAVLSLGQALVAVEAGADIVIPFIGRAEESGAAATQMVEDVVWAAADAGRRALLASVKTVDHVRCALRAGCWGVTLPPDLVRALGRNDATDALVAHFRAAASTGRSSTGGA